MGMCLVLVSSKFRAESEDNISYNHLTVWIQEQHLNAQQVSFGPDSVHPSILMNPNRLTRNIYKTWMHKPNTSQIQIQDWIFNFWSGYGSTLTRPVYIPIPTNSINCLDSAPKKKETRNQSKMWPVRAHTLYIQAKNSRSSNGMCSAFGFIQTAKSLHQKEMWTQQSAQEPPSPKLRAIPAYIHTHYTQPQ